MRYEKFLNIVIKWNHNKNFTNFKMIYKFGFENNSILYHFPPWKIWRILKHTYIDKKYEKIEKDIDNYKEL